MDWGRGGVADGLDGGGGCGRWPSKMRGDGKFR